MSFSLWRRNKELGKFGNIYYWELNKRYNKSEFQLTQLVKSFILK